MPTLYQYICDTCREAGINIDDTEKMPGTLTEMRAMDDRDKEMLCPHCKKAMRRPPVPEKFTVWWGSPHTKKKTSLGPTIDYYPPTRERERKEHTRHVDMGGSGIKPVEKHEPATQSIANVPPPGVGITKG
jgi:hypothetical protein